MDATSYRQQTATLRDMHHVDPHVAHRRQRRTGCRGRDPQYFDMCFYFFPSAELLNTGTSIKFIIQLQSMGHMNLKNNTPRTHHIIKPF